MKNPLDKIREVIKHDPKKRTLTFSYDDFDYITSLRETSYEDDGENRYKSNIIQDKIYIVHDTWTEKMIGVYNNIQSVMDSVIEFVNEEERDLRDYGIIIYRSKINNIRDYLEENDVFPFYIISEETEDDE